MGNGCVERRKHEIADAQQRQTGHSRHSQIGAEHQQEDLDDVMVALEVAQAGMAAQDLGNDIE